MYNASIQIGAMFHEGSHEDKLEAIGIAFRETTKSVNWKEGAEVQVTITTPSGKTFKETRKPDTLELVG